MQMRVLADSLMANGNDLFDRKTVMTGGIALVAGMIVSLMFQGALPFQQRTEAANQQAVVNSQLDELNQKLTARIDTVTQAESADRSEISLLRDNSTTSAMETQKGIDDIKVQLVAIQTRLDMMDPSKAREKR